MKQSGQDVEDLLWVFGSRMSAEEVCLTAFIFLICYRVYNEIKNVRTNMKSFHLSFSLNVKPKNRIRKAIQIEIHHAPSYMYADYLCMLF
jgi:hypothetical protein